MDYLVNVVEIYQDFMCVCVPSFMQSLICCAVSLSLLRLKHLDIFNSTKLEPRAGGNKATQRGPVGHFNFFFFHSFN